MTLPPAVGRTQTRPDKRDAIAHAEQAGAYRELVSYARALRTRARGRRHDWMRREADRADAAAERVLARGLGRVA